jgi:ribosomal protein S18 acetylase RimI-like enzyme
VRRQAAFQNQLGLGAKNSPNISKLGLLAAHPSTEFNLAALSTIQMLGLAGVLSYAAARFAARAGMLGYNRYVLVAVPVDGMPKMPRGFRVEPLDADKLTQHQIDVSHSVQEARFAQGLVCLGAFNSKNELVGVNWIGRGPFVEDEVHVRFSVPDNAGWDTGLWVRPEYRLGRGFAALWAGTAVWLSSQGLSWSMSRIADYNLPSILSHKRMGAVTLGHVTAIRFFRWQWMGQGRPRVIRLTGNAPAEMKIAFAAHS